ncbi:hypothetical protein CMI45_01240 [Candidatus Pacearchaeota archaeon]|nr:hypothetical protein [Candidatus Pacearchaeota archaeon]|tara:strand:+ start:1972 stop:2598 length:627 start_codon:yes stop_codon:yes gene_type:complete
MPNEPNNPILNFSKTLAKRTPGSSYKDLLHIGNNGNGIDDTSPINIFDGKGTWTGISLSREQINLDLGGGRMQNALLGGSRFSIQKEVVYDHSDVFLNLHEHSFFYITQGDPLAHPYGLDYNTRVFLNFTTDADDAVFVKGKLFVRNISDVETTLEIATDNGTISGGGLQNEFSGTDLFIYDIFCLYNVDGNENNEFIVQLADRTSIV